ncbi:MAG TPA: M56 family metallopeptidase [Rhizomicrobium sp.]|nr:M56 family metallopeptidase [Rhizomicrobium sp.]
MIASLLNHLWQSSLFVGGVGLLVLALQRNSAHVRFWLWFAASIKFLVPFAALTALGAYLLTPVARPEPEVMLIAPLAQPFSASSPVVAAPLATAAPMTHLDLAPILLALWTAGFAVIVIRWLVRWSRVRKLLQEAIDAPLAAPVAVKFSASRLEPGLVGILRPVILLPQGIEQQLAPAELNAILAHELCHWRRHDNLLAAIHMLVEALFWFFPLVWWLGARLNAERERACDESVLAAGNDPEMYAEGILKVCRVYLQTPLACVAGVSGAGLKKRMETIMENGLVLRLNAVRKLMLSASAAAVVAIPLSLGLAAAPVLVQAQAEPAPSSTLNAQRRAEQAMPRKPVAFDPAHFDKYVGYYQLAPSVVFTIKRNGDHFFSRLTGQVDIEMFPESETKFFVNEVHAQVSFISNAQGQATELVLHQNGQEQHAPRITEAAAKSIEASLLERIRSNKPSPGTEAALRHQIESMEKGQRDYSVLTPALTSAVKEMEPNILAALASMGPLKSIKFRTVMPGGADNYIVEFERGSSEWFISPLTADGKISGMSWRRTP